MKLNELLVEEKDLPFGDWPETLHLYGQYVAIREEALYNYVRYDVERILGEKTNVQLAASLIRPSMREPHTGATFTLGLDGDFAQKLGIQLNGAPATDIKEFRKWAIDAMKSASDRLGLNEDARHRPKVAEAVDNFPIRHRIRNWDKEVYLKGGYTMTMEEHQHGKTAFKITRLMEESPCGIAYIFHRRQAGFVQWWSLHEPSGRQLDVQGVSDGEAFDQDLFKKWVTSNLAKLPDNMAK